MENDFLHNWDIQLKKGLLPLFVMQALKTKEFYGYELIQELKASINMDIPEGTMYPLLIRLTKNNLLTSKWVEQNSGIPRKYYNITKEGKANLKEMKILIETMKKQIL